MRAPTLVCITVGILSGGCALDLSGIPSDRPMLMDAGALDGATGDSGARSDAGPGTGCDPSEQRCDMGRAIRCEGDMTVIDNCLAAMLACTEEEGAPHCAPRVCTPGASRCVDDDVATCNAAGTTEVRTVCAEGCEDGRCAEPAPCDAMDVSEGVYDFGLCGHGDDLTPTPQSGDGCIDSLFATGEDRMLRFEVTRAGTYRIHLRDIIGDGIQPDPVVHIRTTCDDPSTQFACNDDGLGGPGGRDAVIVRRFAVGTYYIAVDSYGPCAPVRMLLQWEGF